MSILLVPSPNVRVLRDPSGAVIAFIDSRVTQSVPGAKSQACPSTSDSREPVAPVRNVGALL